MRASVRRAPRTEGAADEILVQRYRDGDESAFSLLLERHGPRLRRRVRRRLPACLDRKVSESDVLQEAMTTGNSWIFMSR